MSGCQAFQKFGKFSQPREKKGVKSTKGFFFWEKWAEVAKLFDRLSSFLFPPMISSQIWLSSCQTHQIHKFEEKKTPPIQLH